MRYALISDIHANLPALDAVLGSISSRGDIAATYHLGDLVGYGPWPNETVGRIREHGISGIQGNHEAVIARSGRPAPADPGTVMDQGDWTARETAAENKAFLGALPFRMDLRPHGGHLSSTTVILVHGTMVRCDNYWYEDQPESFFREMAALAGAKPGDVVCCGHTHLPWQREVEGIHYLNTGSVGRPKDGDWRAGYVVLELSSGPPAVEFARVEYDLDRTMREIRRSTLSDDLAEFLRTGGASDAG